MKYILIASMMFIGCAVKAQQKDSTQIKTSTAAIHLSAPRNNTIEFDGNKYWLTKDGKRVQLYLAEYMYVRGSKIYYHPDGQQYEEQIKTFFDK